MPDRSFPTTRVAVADVLARWRAEAPPPGEAEVPLPEAIGAVVAHDVATAAPVPATAVALIDGRAVIAAETFGASPYTPADLSRSLEVAAGDPVPPPFDAVAAADEGTATTADVALAPGTELRRVGTEATAGTRLATAGTRIDARLAAVLATAGIPRVQIATPPVLLVVDPEDETAGVVAGFLAGRIAARGTAAVVVSPERADRASERPWRLALFLGGRAIGGHDRAWIAATASTGWRTIGRPALRPGETMVAGRIGATPTLVLPARVDDALAALLALIEPWLDDGRTDVAADAETRPLARKMVSAIGFSELALVAERDGAWDPLAIGTFGAAAVAAATHWHLLSPESEGIDAAAPLAARPLTPEPRESGS
ncbi:MAG: hypothetical protein GX458_19615 [Phyllobacteriaceae bacterium]|nr:hypothetical protein [Phyllobacteriaceae bacterium]